MSAPARAAEVVAIVERHRDLFGTDDSRRGILYHICAELNKTDSGHWGLLRKDDQGGFVPSDIIMWRPMREIFDVLLGGPDRAGWLPLGVVTNPSWVWMAAPPVAGVRPSPIDVGGAAERAELLEALETLVDALSSLTVGIEALDRRLAALTTTEFRIRGVP